MTNQELQPIRDLVELELAQSGLSAAAIRTVQRLGNFLRDHPKIPLAVGAAGYIGEVIINQLLHPEWGIGANIFSPIFFDVSPVERQYRLNALQGFFQGMFVSGGATGVVSGVAAEVRKRFELPDIKAGRAKNPYTKMLLMLDTTNEALEGSTHGDFYNEFYSYLLSLPQDTVAQLIKRYGPVCEIVPENVPEPADEPPIAYFRTPNPANTGFLRDTVKAERSQGTITVLMSRSHTVWDEAYTPAQPIIDTANNMNNTIADTLKAGDIPKILITNNKEIVTHGAFDPSTGSTRTEETNTAEYFKERGYRVTIAEEKVMKDLVDTFKAKKMKRVVLMDDGTKEGERIAGNWLKDYQRFKLADKDLPEVIEVPEGKLGEVLQNGTYDAGFLIGAEDGRVAEAALAILEKQRAEEVKGRYKKVPLEVLLEGRGSADKLDQVETDGGGLHFVHEILAKNVVADLLTG